MALPRDSYLQDYFADVTSVMRVGPPLFFVVRAHTGCMHLSALLSETLLSQRALPD